MDDIVVKSKKADQLMADLKKLLRNSKKMASNSIPKSAFSGSRGVCYSGSSSLSTASVVEPSKSYGHTYLPLSFRPLVVARECPITQ
jgi:hypothetical protein